MPQALQYDFVNQIITVPLPDTNLDLQYLVDQTRDAEDNSEPGMAYGQILEAFGKQDLGGGVLVGITVVLLENWRVKFADRPPGDTVSVRISGGNLVGDAGHNPVAPSAYTQVTLANSSSATIATPSSDTNLLYLVESLRGSHKGIGNIFYWNPYSGDDSKDGTTPNTAVKTFSAAHTLVSSGNYDIIYCLAKDPSGTTITTELLNITKNGLKLRGPGYTFQLKPTLTTAPTVTIAASNVEIEGIYLETATTGSQDGITVSGDYNLIQDSWLNNIRGNGISITSSSRNKILKSVIENCGGSGIGNGISISNNTTKSLVSQCIIDACINGVSLTGTGITDNVIENNIIYKNTTTGLTIGSGVLKTTVRGANTIVNNPTNTQDVGTDTYIESQAGGASASEIADAVWNEVISGHTTAGTTGKTLKDAKTKATLASLK